MITTKMAPMTITATMPEPLHSSQLSFTLLLSTSESVDLCFVLVDLCLAPPPLPCLLLLLVRFLTVTPTLVGGVTVEGRTLELEVLGRVC